MAAHHPPPLQPHLPPGGAEKGKPESYGFFKPTPQVWQAGKETRVVVFQCPPSFSPREEYIAQMRDFFRRAGEGFLLAWEPRGEWPEEIVRGLCQELGLVHCVGPFLRTPAWGQINYFRLHGGPGYRHRYSQEELRGLQGMAGGKESYVLFNNLAMHQDAQRFLRLLGQ